MHFFVCKIRRLPSSLSCPLDILPKTTNIGHLIHHVWSRLLGRMESRSRDDLAHSQVHGRRGVVSGIALVEDDSRLEVVLSRVLAVHSLSP